MPQKTNIVVIHGTETANYIQFRAPSKNTNYFKKVSNESCSKLNFVQKSSRAHISISTWSGARALERLIWLLYYMVLKLQITFTFRAKCCHKYALFQKKLQIKVVKTELRTKKSGSAYVYFPWSGAMTLERLIWFYGT